MTDTNPYQPPLAGAEKDGARRAARKGALWELLLMGSGATIGTLIALPFLRTHFPWALGGPLIGSVVGGVATRLHGILSGAGTEGVKLNFRLCAIFLICGPALTLTAGAIILKLAGEAVSIGSLTPFVGLGAIYIRYGDKRRRIVHSLGVEARACKAIGLRGRCHGYSGGSETG